MSFFIRVDYVSLSLSDDSNVISFCPLLTNVHVIAFPFVDAKQKELDCPLVEGTCTLVIAPYAL